MHYKANPRSSKTSSRLSGSFALRWLFREFGKFPIYVGLQYVCLLTISFLCSSPAFSVRKRETSKVKSGKGIDELPEQGMGIASSIVAIPSWVMKLMAFESYL